MTDSKHEHDATSQEPEVIPPHPESDAEGSELDLLAAENAKLKDQALRALAEVENMRRRAERDREDANKYAISSFARDLLSVADNLNRALAAVPADHAGDETVKNLIAGVEATERELLAAFERRGLTRIAPMGEKFDPNFHQAMFEVPDNSHPVGTVVQVLAPGWVIHDRLLRPAMVGVSKAAEPVRVDTKA
jgi:molecular chaperone GrpE